MPAHAAKPLCMRCKFVQRKKYAVRCKKEHLHNIISLRISDNQKIMLESLSKATSKSISDIMREAVNLWSAKRRKLCVD